MTTFRRNNDIINDPALLSLYFPEISFPTYDPDSLDRSMDLTAPLPPSAPYVQSDLAEAADRAAAAEIVAEEALIRAHAAEGAAAEAGRDNARLLELLADADDRAAAAEARAADLEARVQHLSSAVASADGRSDDLESFMRSASAEKAELEAAVEEARNVARGLAGQLERVTRERDDLIESLQAAEDDLQSIPILRSKLTSAEAAVDEARGWARSLDAQLRATNNALAEALHSRPPQIVGVVPAAGWGAGWAAPVGGAGAGMMEPEVSGPPQMAAPAPSGDMYNTAHASSPTYSQHPPAPSAPPSAPAPAPSPGLPSGRVSRPPPPPDLAALSTTELEEMRRAAARRRSELDAQLAGEMRAVMSAPTVTPTSAPGTAAAPGTGPAYTAPPPASQVHNLGLGAAQARLTECRLREDSLNGEISKLQRAVRKPGTAMKLQSLEAESQQLSAEIDGLRRRIRELGY